MPLQLAELLYKHRDRTGDVTFVVESQRIRAHRCALAASSSTYNKEFFSSKPHGGDDIAVPNVAASDFNEFIKCFYSQPVNLTRANVGTILDLAVKSGFKECVAECETFLGYHTNDIANICWVLALAIKYKLSSVRICCDAKIGMNALEVFKSNGFIECSYEVLLNIMHNRTLNCDEIEVLRACVSWAKNECRDGNTKALRLRLGHAVHLIRFASMNIHQFCEFHKEHDGFFSPEEFIEISSIIYQESLRDFKPKKFYSKRRQNRMNY